MPITCRLVSALEKVFIDQAPAPDPGIPLTGLRGELMSFQAALTQNPPAPEPRLLVRVEASCALPLRVRRVEQMPVRSPCHPDADEHYLRKTPGLYPDALTDLPAGGWFPVYLGQWSALWLDVEPGADAVPGRYPVHLRLLDEEGALLLEAMQQVEVMAATLPAQRLIHARWLHCDALADAYGLAMFSDAHFEVLERYIAHGVRRGINMVLVPIHTPPLDTREGTRRRTAQLVDVHVEAAGYRFGFDRLRRFVALCRRAGVTHYEIAHLFTQWGARHAPQIVGIQDGRQVELFGWATDALGQPYHDFLAAYLPALTGELRSLGIAEQCYFHISDEPGADSLQQVKAARAMVAPYLKGFKVMDAMSDYALFQSGAVSLPVPAVDRLEPFLQADLAERWTYYCVAQHRLVPNTFLAMPASRTRMLGLLLYRYGMHGFLHWAYNFYYAQYADYAVNPWHITDADGFAPAGDALQVYPGRDGEPVDSLRLMLFQHAMQDMRALQALEARLGRPDVLALIEQEAGGLPTFTDYPRAADFLPRLRHRVNALLGALN